VELAQGENTVAVVARRIDGARLRVIVELDAPDH
jgi:hypothetical protein